MSELDNYRKEIDAIDKELIVLFEKRMDISAKVGDYKKKNSLPIFNGKREEEVIEKNIMKLNNKSYSNFAQSFFKNIMELSRLLQENIIKEDKNSNKNIY